jgi:glutathione S-transferase
MQFAHEYAPDQGLELIPKDPVVAAKMRLAMEDFLKIQVAPREVMHSRGEDPVKLDAMRDMISKHNDFAKRAAGGKWLMGTDEPTMLDIHCAPQWEIFCSWMTGPMKAVLDHTKFVEQCPDVIEYVARFKSHDAFKD